MENKFLAWVRAMNSLDFRVKIVTQNRTADKMYKTHEVIKMHQLILDTVQRPGIGSITVTSPCGCAYRFDKIESNIERICNEDWVRAVFNGDVDE